MKISYTARVGFCAAVLALYCILLIFTPSYAAESLESGNVSTVLETQQDKYKIDKHLGSFNGYDVFGTDSTNRFCMEIADMDTEHRVKYADAVNRMADAVGDANVYNIVVPTAAEFYAGCGMGTDYASEIADIYMRLDPKIKTVDAESALGAHLGENIFFKTDHHWTQLGAYYVYSEFLKADGRTADELSEFKTQIIDGMQGSFLTYLKGTDGEKLMSETVDRLELYYPNSVCTGTAYYDCALIKPICEVKAIDPDRMNYDAFLDGDYPIGVFKTNVPGGRKLCIIKESFGNAFAVWALNNYSEVYVVDYRCFNDCYGLAENSEPFSISEFKSVTGFDDLCILSYPITVESDPELSALEKMTK